MAPTAGGQRSGDDAHCSLRPEASGVTAHSAGLGRLSAASHHHAYEMPPTAAELNRMLDTVHDVIDAIRARRQAPRESKS